MAGMWHWPPPSVKARFPGRSRPARGVPKPFNLQLFCLAAARSLLEWLADEVGAGRE